MWGDARLGNQMSRDGEIVAVLDWEMVALGDPRIDLGWWIFCDDVLSTGTGGSRLPGFPSASGDGGALGGAHRTRGRRSALVPRVRRRCASPW